MTAKYEYQIVHLPKFLDRAQSKLNTLGKDSWELITFFQHSDPDKFIDEAANPEKDVLIGSPLFAIMKSVKP